MTAVALLLATLAAAPIAHIVASLRTPDPAPVRGRPHTPARASITRRWNTNAQHWAARTAVVIRRWPPLPASPPMHPAVPAPRLAEVVVIGRPPLPIGAAA